MPYWGWLAVGVALLVLEVLVQTEFWLALIGAAALGTGLVALVGLADSTSVQWAIFGTLSILMLVFVRRQLHEKLIGSAPGIDPELIGESGVAKEAIAPGATGSVELRGSVWQARNVGSTPVESGAHIAVEAVDGLTLSVRAQ